MNILTCLNVGVCSDAIAKSLKLCMMIGYVEIHTSASDHDSLLRSQERIKHELFFECESIEHFLFCVMCFGQYLKELFDLVQLNTIHRCTSPVRV